MRKNWLSAVLAGVIVLSPALSYADGIVRLSPLTSSPEGYTTVPGQTDLAPLRGRISTIPKGTMMMIKLDQPISSFSSNLGETVSATLENDVFINDSLAVPSGSQVLGQVTHVSRSGKLGKHGEIEIHFVSIKTPDGTLMPVRAHIVTSDETGILKGNTYGNDILRGVGLTVGGTALGAGLGVATGSLLGAVGSGVLFGTAVGGIAGVTYAMTRQGKDVVVPSGSRMSVVVDQPVSLNQ